MTLQKIDSFHGATQVFFADATGDTLREVFTPAGSYFVTDYSVLDRTALRNKEEVVNSLRNPIAVSFWGSHPDEDNDDCWTAEDFSSLKPALEAFNAECFETGVRFIMIDGPGIHLVRESAHYRASVRDDSDWQNEAAMQAGMAFGCDGYNDERGC